jgi:hypothetical protein
MDHREQERGFFYATREAAVYDKTIDLVAPYFTTGQFC